MAKRSSTERTVDYCCGTCNKSQATSHPPGVRN